MARESVCGSDMLADRLSVIRHKVAFLDDAMHCEGFSDQGRAGVIWILRELGQDIDAVMEIEEAEREAQKRKEA